ncbi:GNAT family N-acetyltransferase [Streptomyces sp. NPDC057249]|uniref:GNAT family N-acetyltransferase n=1 Tax=Streptomyces sp. NPDC057249 TaxID=3346067 RepID=UPI00362808B7
MAARAPLKEWVSLAVGGHTPGTAGACSVSRVLLSVAFTTAGLHRLEAMHHPDNPASGRVLIKAGFTHIGTSDRQADSGTTVPYQVYALQN